MCVILKGIHNRDDMWMARTKELKRSYFFDGIFEMSTTKRLQLGPT
jgi:hypothetical protein